MSFSASDLLTLTREGLYCPLGGFHVDPTWPVPRALITHGHADHARAGHGRVLATGETLRIMAVRYGADFCESRQEAPLGEEIRIGDVTVRFAPAGHVLGSAQIAIEAQGVRVVVSGDYKRAYDPTCLPFEVVPCDVFITEATFGLPVFRMPDTRDEVRKLLDSVALFPERAHIVGAYALGKAAAGHGPAAGGRLRPADLPARRDGEADRALQAGGHSAGRGPRRWWRPSGLSSTAPSCSARPPRSRTSGRASSPTP